MTKKIAGQAGGLVSAGGEVSCPGDLPTFDYTESLQKLQEEVSGKFGSKKVMSMTLARVYDLLSFSGRASRVSDCGSFLQFSLDSDGSKRLTRANFCRDRLCPTCNWRRSLKVFSQLSQCMEVLENSGLSFIFLTLTVRNCPASCFSSTIDLLLAGWSKLYRDFRQVRRICEGSFRSLEVTINQKNGTYHPHLHVVIAVKPGYFSGRDYISQAKWTEYWRLACGLSYRPVVDVRKVTLSDQSFKSRGLKEVAKYLAKGSDYLVGSPSVMMHRVSTLLSGLSDRRLSGFTGCFSKVRKALNLDDPETGDLVVTDGQQLRSDLCTMIVRYQWRSGVYVRL